MLKYKKAFTLIELMIVVAIVAILAMIAVPMYQRYIEQARSNTTRSLLQNLALAEMSLKASPNEDDFIAVVAGLSPENAIKKLLTVGFRPDPQVAFAVFPVTAADTGAFVAFAAYCSQGATLSVYDNVNGTGVVDYNPAHTFGASLPASITAYHWDGATNTVTAVAVVALNTNGTVASVTTLP